MFSIGDTIYYVPIINGKHHHHLSDRYVNFPFKGFVQSVDEYTKSINNGGGFDRFEFNICEKNYLYTGNRKFNEKQTVFIFGLSEEEILSTRLVLLEKNLLF